MSELTLTARWLFPVAGPPLERGTVTMDGERIVAVEPHGCRTADVDLGDAALLPGLVNAHTHLDLTGMRGLAPPSPDFIGWLRQVIAHRRATTPEQSQADIRAGLEESVRYGTTLLADISVGGASWPVLSRGPLWAVVFYELIGLTTERATRAWADLDHWLYERPDEPTCTPGISPHAPYSAHIASIGAALADALPVAIHVAETAAELDLMARRTGHFVEFLRDLGVWDEAGLATGPQQILDRVRPWSRLLLVHGNYLEPSLPIPHKATIVYCPRTHAAFGHPPHPFRDFLARGVRVALGTDSLASNPDLDLLAEARSIHQRYPDLPGEVLLRMATLSGAEGLGWDEETGTLEPGKSADLIVLPLPAADRADPHQLLFDSALPVRAVLFRGRWVHGGPAS